MNIEELKKEIEIKEKELLNLKEDLKRIKIYETIIILNVNTNIKNFEAIKTKIKEICGTLQIFEELGIKKLAYEIKGNKEGFYIRFEWEGNEKNVASLEDFMKSNNNIMKFITVRKNEGF